MKLAIIGGGSWGTALATVLAPRMEEVRLWVHEEDLAVRMQKTRENDVFLPGYTLAPVIQVSSTLAEVIPGSDIVLGVMPSRHARWVYGEMLPFLDPSMTVVSATKGLEQGSLLRMSEVIREVLLGRARFSDESTIDIEPSIAVLSGPTFAREVARGDPTAVVIASEKIEVAQQVQDAFSGPSFRLYTNLDPIGVEMGAALKNIIAIGAGIVHGLGLGSNTQAALVTRGLAEITRLAVAMGAKPTTLAGLAGMGDLVLTCSGGLSRNRKVGIELADGRTLQEIVGSMRMVAEGVETCTAAVELGTKKSVDLPIIQQMHAVLAGAKTPQAAVRDLMERQLRSE